MPKRSRLLKSSKGMRNIRLSVVHEKKLISDFAKHHGLTKSQVKVWWNSLSSGARERISTGWYLAGIVGASLVAPEIGLLTAVGLIPAHILATGGSDRNAKKK